MTNAHSATPCCDFLSRLQPRWAVLNGGGGAGEPATAGTTPGRRAQLPHGHATSGISREVQTERGLVAYRRYLELKSGGDGGATSDEAVAILRQLAREPYLADVVEEARAELEEKTTSQRVAAAMDPSDTLVDSCENAVDLQSRPSRFLAYVTHRNYAEWLERSNARLLDDDPLEHYMKVSRTGMKSLLALCKD